jgi:protein phosphatase
VHERLDLVPLDVEVGDRLLLCSDGLTDLVRDEAIADLLAVEDADAAAAACVEAALAAGGRDNVTCVVVDVVDGPSIVGDGQLLGAVREIGNIVDPAGLGRR